MATRAEIEKKANQLAAEFCEAKKCGNTAQKNIAWAKLYRLLMGNDGSNPVNDILNSKINKYKAHNSNLSDFIVDNIMKYDYDRNNNFCAFLYQNFEYYLKDYTKKEYVSRTNKQTGEKEKEFRNITRYDENGEPVFDNIENLISNPETESAEKEKAAAVRISLLSVITQFYSHNKGKSANSQRLSYFRIFFTENLIILIQDTNSLKGFNRTEAYSNSDQSFVRFISRSDYDKIEDLLTLDFKFYSEIMKACEKEDKQISLPCENIVIQQYRYQNGMDEKEVSLSNITQQRKKYAEALKEILQEELSF